MRAAGYFSWSLLLSCRLLPPPHLSILSQLSLSSWSCSICILSSTFPGWWQVVESHVQTTYPTVLPAQQCFPAWPLPYPGALTCALASPIFLPLRSHSPKWLWTPGYSGASQKPWFWTLTCKTMQQGALCLRVCTISTCLGVRTEKTSQCQPPGCSNPDTRESFPAGGFLWLPTPSEQALNVYGSRAFDQNFKGWLVHSETAQPNHYSTSWTFSFPWFSPPLPVFSPFLLLPFLNWVWNWSIFLNYLYLLNKVFNVPVLKFRLVCLSQYLPFPTPSSPKIVYLLSCVLIGVQTLGTYVSFLLVALSFWKGNLNWVSGFLILFNSGCI